MRAALIIGSALFLSSCTPRHPAVEFGNVALDCRKGFDALRSEIVSIPGVVADEHDRGSSAYRDDRALKLYLITQPDHPAHPAIFVRQVVPSIEVTQIISGGCGFGDQSALERELKAYQQFDRLLNAEEDCFMCTPSRLESPTVDRRRPPPPPPPL